MSATRNESEPEKLLEVSARYVAMSADGGTSAFFKSIENAELYARRTVRRNPCCELGIYSLVEVCTPKIEAVIYPALSDDS